MSNKLQYSFTLPGDVKPVIRKLLHDFTKWQQVHRTQETFFQQFHEWLSVFISFNKTEQVLKTLKKSNSGCPSLDFKASSE